MQVFQPLLLEYFSYDELCQLRLRVIELHQERQELEKFTWTECEKESSCSCNICIDISHYFCDVINFCAEKNVALIMWLEHV